MGQSLPAGAGVRGPPLQQEEGEEEVEGVKEGEEEGKEEEKEEGVWGGEEEEEGTCERLRVATERKEEKEKKEKGRKSVEHQNELYKVKTEMRKRFPQANM